VAANNIGLSCDEVFRAFYNKNSVNYENFCARTREIISDELNYELRLNTSGVYDWDLDLEISNMKIVAKGEQPLPNAKCVLVQDVWRRLL